MVRTLALPSIAGALALLCAAPFAAQQSGQPVIQQTDRALARVVYFGQRGVSGEYSIEYGKPEWKAEYDKNFDKMTHGKRLRLGKDYWTNLDTCCPLMSGDKEIKPGNYFLALECNDKGSWELVLLDSDQIRKQRVDAFSSEQTTGGQKLPMKHETVADASAQLSIKFLADEKDQRLQTLEIHFGKHRLTAPIQPKV